MGTKRLIDLLKTTICTGEFNPFSGTLYSQDGIVAGSHDNNILSPEEIVKMDWLAENIIGSIPQAEELTEKAMPVISQQGLQNKNN